MSLISLCGRKSPDPILCRSPVGNYSCWSFKRVPAMPCSEDRVPQQQRNRSMSCAHRHTESSQLRLAGLLCYWLTLTLKSSDFFETNIHTSNSLSSWLVRVFRGTSLNALLCQLVSTKHMNCLYKYYLKPSKYHYPLFQHQLDFREYTRWVLMNNRPYGVYQFLSQELFVSRLAMDIDCIKHQATLSSLIFKIFIIIINWWWI